MIKKVIEITFFVLFSLFAMVQYNDPDGPAWILIYGSVAIVSLLSAVRVYRRSIVMGMIIALSIFAIYLSPHFYDYLLAANKNELFGDMVYEKPYIEGTREFGGVVIAILCLLGLLRINRKP
ncbi:MAG: transmembrane 220 family protein [Cyclobacteriaceae bacterium]